MLYRLAFALLSAPNADTIVHIPPVIPPAGGSAWFICYLHLPSSG